MATKPPPKLERDEPVDAPGSEPRGAPPHHGGRTTTMRDERGAHPLPHERDESTAADATGTSPATPSGGPSDLGRRARRDVESGVADTSRAETADETYAREFRADPGTPAHRRAPAGKRS